jgi:hypothetical protein
MKLLSYFCMNNSIYLTVELLAMWCGTTNSTGSSEIACVTTNINTQFFFILLNRIQPITKSEINSKELNQSKAGSIRRGRGWLSDYRPNCGRGGTSPPTPTCASCTMIPAGREIESPSDHGIGCRLLRRGTVASWREPLDILWRYPELLKALRRSLPETHARPPARSGDRRVCPRNLFFSMSWCVIWAHASPRNSWAGASWARSINQSSIWEQTVFHHKVWRVYTK